MAVIERSALVMHSAEAMYELVNDVLSYPRFLPWCSRAELISETEQEMQASLEISKGGIRQTFATRNELSSGRRIQMNLLDGPFKRLEGVWEFKPLNDEACKVSLHLEFEVGGKIGAMALGAVFNQVANTLVDSFCKRADELYG